MPIDDEEETMSTPKVFVTQYTRRLDFTELNKYGEVVFLTRNEYEPEPVPAEVNQVVKGDIERGMQDYIAGIDYIVTTGSALPNLIVGGIISGMTIGNVKPEHRILKWSNRDHKYELYKL